MCDKLFKEFTKPNTSDGFEFINPNNPDCEMEKFWYGFKNLIFNYYDTLTDDENIKFSSNINDFSKKLNELQEEKKYDEIYDEIYNYLKKFINSLIKKYELTSRQNNKYFFSWLKRYNKIPNINKLESKQVYNKNLKFMDVSEDEIILLKLKILENDYDPSLINLLDTDKYAFLNYCLEYKYENLFDHISLRFNIDDFFVKEKLPYKGQIKAKKILKHYDVI